MLKNSTLRMTSLFIALSLLISTASSALAAGYDNAFKGVHNYKAVFDVTQDNPKGANIVFWAVKNAYESTEVKALGVSPEIAVVFRGPAVKLLSTNREPFNADQWAEVEKFQETLRQMKKDRVKLEVCQYAVEVMGVDKTTIIPEIDLVPNGFVSMIGYQMQDYAVVRIH